MARIFLRFPQGRDKALTLSYDDGVEQDIRLIEIMQRHGLKGTFNINSGLYAPEGKVYAPGTVHRRLPLSKLRQLYLGSGMEVAVHGLTHAFQERLPVPGCNYETLQDRVNLERDFGCIVRGMAYPYGTYSDQVVEVLKHCGIAYARTVQTTEGFEIPTDWLRLRATCHHKHPRLLELADSFLNQPSPYGRPKLFYLWGHSYEFELDDNWHVIEAFAELVGNREDVWYATNLEICDYVSAYERLIYSVEGHRIYNPTCTDVYVCINEQVHCIKAGRTVTLEKQNDP